MNRGAYAYAYFVKDLDDGGYLVECQACGYHQAVANRLPFGPCGECDAELMYPPGAIW